MAFFFRRSRERDVTAVFFGGLQFGGTFLAGSGFRFFGRTAFGGSRYTANFGGGTSRQNRDRPNSLLNDVGNIPDEYPGIFFSQIFSCIRSYFFLGAKSCEEKRLENFTFVNNLGKKSAHFFATKIGDESFAAGLQPVHVQRTRLPTCVGPLPPYTSTSSA